MSMTSDENLTAWLTSKHSEGRCYGRMIASGAPEVLNGWLIAEQEMGHVSIFDILFALTSLYAGAVLPLLAVSTGVDKESVDNLLGLLRERLGHLDETLKKRAATP